MARPEYVESPRSSRHRRCPPLPPAPEVGDWTEAEDIPQDSPPRRRTTDRARDTSRQRDRDGGWWRDEEIKVTTPESRRSSSSSHPPHQPQHQRHYYSEYRRPAPSTPSHSISSSKTSMRTTHPPRSSMTRPSSSKDNYRRPSVSVREPTNASYDDEASRPESRRSPSRHPSLHVYSSAPSRRNSRTIASASVSTSESGDDTEATYETQDDERRVRRAPLRAEPVVHVRRDERSRSRADPRRRHRRSDRRREDWVRPDEEDDDEIDSRHTHSLDELPPKRPRPRPRSHSRPRPHFEPPSVRHGQDQDADSEEEEEEYIPDARDRSDRSDRRDHRRHRHTSHTREHRRIRSASHARPSSPPRRYVLTSVFGGTGTLGSSKRARSRSRSLPKRTYDTDIVSVEKHDRYHPPSASLRISDTVSSPQVTESQHQSVSSSTRRSSSSHFLGYLLGPSLHHHHRASDKPVKIVECIVCMDDLPSRKTAHLKCGHRMCHSCLKRSFKLSITDPQHMPPKCCTADNIPLKHVERLFDNDFKKTWNRKFVEYSTRNRLYCPKRSCGEFIRPENFHHAKDGRKYGECGRCRGRVCIRCNGKWHSTRDCPKDEETVKFLAQAKDEGWQRCFRCKSMVELKEGCNHMTCRCGAQFCMICGERWKTCECPWFSYDAVENDRLQHMQIPIPIRDPFGGRAAMDPPPSPPRDARPGSGPSPFSGPRPRPQNYEEEMSLQRLQENRDEQYARRLQNYRGFDNDREVDFMGGFGEVNGVGNAAGHHLNEDFRPRPHNLVVSQPPLPRPPPPPPAVQPEPAPVHERDDYVHGVNRARGVRNASQERRLADRFNSDLRQSPTHRSPPSLLVSATMPLTSMVPALGPAHTPGPATVPIRRRTMEDDMYDEEPRQRSGGTRTIERVTASGSTVRPVVYDEPEQIVPKGSIMRKQALREPIRELPQSVMAGLSGPGRGLDRVFEWRTHVAPGHPAEASSVASS